LRKIDLLRVSNPAAAIAARVGRSIGEEMEVSRYTVVDQPGARNTTLDQAMLHDGIEHTGAGTVPSRCPICTCCAGKANGTIMANPTDVSYQRIVSVPRTTGCRRHKNAKIAAIALSQVITSSHRAK